MKKVMISLGTFGLLCIGVVVAVFAIVGRDIPPPDTTDLIPERNELLPEQNAYTYFILATNSFYWPTNDSVIIDYLDQKPVDDGTIQEIISHNTNFFDIIGKGLECRRYIPPEVTGVDTLLPHIGPLRGMGRVIALKARHERLAKRYKEATSTCISLLRFGDIVQNDAGCYIHYLVGVAVLRLGLTQVQDLARDKGIPSEELTRLSEVLAALGPFDRGLIRAAKGEYKVAANTIDRFRDGTFDKGETIGPDNVKADPIWKRKRVPSYCFQPNATKLIFANACRDMTKNSSLSYGSMKLFKVEEDFWSNENKIMRSFRPNALGRMIYGMLIPSFDGLLDRKCRVDCDVAAARIIIACNLYRRAEGKLPDKLQSLVPKYLPTIPVDPYDGQPFRYLPSARIVYSVGKDLKDSGGSTKLPKGEIHDGSSKNRWKTEDIVFQVNEAEKKAPEVQDATNAAQWDE